MPTAAPTTVLDLALFPGLIQHHPDYRLLYCRPCTAVISIGALWRHLQDHHRVPLVQRKLLLKHCQSLDLIPKLKDLRLPIDHSLALQFLPVRQGYSCRQCRYLTSCRDSVRGHINTTHKLYRQAGTDSYHSVQLQTWFPAPRAQYWMVRSKATATPPRHSTAS
jgi:hypothetical protein